MLVICPTSLIGITLAHLREAGHRRCECVVLWLGHKDKSSIMIEEIYHPQQIAKEDMFHIPHSGMNALYDHLRKNRYMVAAQVHSHPLHAFHSEADNRWAIIRHEGALSLVVPNFAMNITAHNFLDHTKTYIFSAKAQWVEISTNMVKSCLRIS